MSSVALQLLRRTAIALLVLSAVLFAGSRVLREAGILGPGAEEMVAQAAGALDAAHAYGATVAMASYVDAQGQLSAARAALARGDGHEARKTARAALASAIVAQREALVRREELRKRAAVVSDELSQEMDRLESLYDDVTPGLPRPEVMRLLSRMKKARELGAGVVLANEQTDYEKVSRDEAAARVALTAMRAELESATRK